MKPLARQFFTVLGLLLMVGAVFAVPVYAGEQAQQMTFQAPILVVNTSFLNVRTGPGAEYSVLVTVVGGTELPVLGVARDLVWYQVATDGGPGWVNVTFTLPRGEFSNVPLVDPDSVMSSAPVSAAVNTTVVSGQNVQGFTLVGANIRTQPDFNALIVNSTVPVDPNTVYPLLGRTQGSDGVEWYLIDVPGVGSGWTDRISFRLLECGTDQVGVITTQTTVRFDGISNRDSFDIPALTEGYLQGYAGTDRIRFQLFDGSVGLVSVADVARRTGVNSVCAGVSVESLGQGGGSVESGSVVASSLAANRVIVNTGNLNVRSGPAAGFSVVATIPGGTELVVLGRATDNVWYLVEGDFGQGWLNSQFVIFRGNYSTVPVIRDAVITETVTSLGQGGGSASVVTSGRQVTGVSLTGKDVRQQPDYASLVLSRNTPNDPSIIYPLLGTQTIAGTVWYLVNVPGVGPGWMDGVQLRVLECGTDQVGTITQQTTIRFDGIAARDPFLLDLNTEGYIVGRNGDFVLFELLDGSVGLVNANDVARRTGVTSICEGVSTAVGAAPAPSDAGTSSPASVTQPSVTGNRVVINTGNLNVRSGPAAGFSVVATVPGGTQLAVVGRAPDGIWYYVEGTFGRGWLNSEFVLFRGDYGSVPVINISGS